MFSLYQIITYSSSPFSDYFRAAEIDKETPWMVNTDVSVAVSNQTPISARDDTNQRVRITNDGLCLRVTNYGVSNSMANPGFTASFREASPTAGSRAERYQAEAVDPLK